MSNLLALAICSGTCCYLCGGAELFSIRDHLPAETARRVLLTGSPCLNQCKDRSDRPPFVRINGAVHGSMDLPGLRDLLTGLTDLTVATD